MGYVLSKWQLSLNFALRIRHRSPKSFQILTSSEGKKYRNLTYKSSFVLIEFVWRDSRFISAKCPRMTQTTLSSLWSLLLQFRENSSEVSQLLVLSSQFSLLSSSKLYQSYHNYVWQNRFHKVNLLQQPCIFFI